MRGLFPENWHTTLLLMCEARGLECPVHLFGPGASRAAFQRPSGERLIPRGDDGGHKTIE